MNTLLTSVFLSSSFKNFRPPDFLAGSQISNFWSPAGAQIFLPNFYSCLTLAVPLQPMAKAFLDLLFSNEGAVQLQVFSFSEMNGNYCRPNQSPPAGYCPGY